MRYPLWAFFFVLVMPIFAAHALLTGKAELVQGPQTPSTTIATSAPIYWTHVASAPVQLQR